LSGCPSVTDSDVNMSCPEDMKVLLIHLSLMTKQKPLPARRG
jgi:hypothetical protein